MDAPFYVFCSILKRNFFLKNFHTHERIARRDRMRVQNSERCEHKALSAKERSDQVALQSSAAFGDEIVGSTTNLAF